MEPTYVHLRDLRAELLESWLDSLALGPHATLNFEWLIDWLGIDGGGQPWR